VALLLILLLLSLSFGYEIISDRLEVVGEKIVAEGRVELFYGNYHVRADRVEFYREREELFASGNVYIKNLKSGLEVWGSYAYLNIKKDRGYFLDARGKFRNFNFQAEKVEKVGKDKYEVYRGLVTTCPLEDKELYLCIFRAKVSRERALLLGNTLRFFRVPIFFLPFYSVPLGGRRSGLLFPMIGSTTYSPFIYRQPIYVALARDRDLTLTLDYRENQGRGIELEYRQVFTSRDYWKFGFSLFREDTPPGEWWEGRELFRENRFSYYLSLNYGYLDLGVEEVSDPYFYEDIAFQRSVRTKPYTLTHINYRLLGPDYSFYATLRRYRDLTRDSNKATVHLFPETSFMLFPKRVAGLDLSGLFSFTNFYTEEDGSYPRIIVNPTIGKFFQLFKVNNFSQITFINQFYPVSGKRVNTYRFSHTVPQYLYVRYGNLTNYNLFEVSYNYSPSNYELEIYDFRDEVVKENQVGLLWNSELSGKRTYFRSFVRAGYNFLQSYKFPTDGTLVEESLLPVYFNFSVYPLESLTITQDGIYDFNLGIMARSITSLSWRVRSLSFSLTNSVFRNSDGERTSDQLSGRLSYSGEFLTASLSVSYDRLVQKEIYRGVFVGFKGKCWSLGIDYKRRYFRTRNEYVDEAFLRFNIFFVETIEIPLSR